MGFLLVALVFTFGAAEAQFVLGLLSSIIVPFVTSFLVRPDTNKYVKLAVAFGLSVVGGLLTVFLAGGLTGSVILVCGSVFAASQVWFGSWFTGLGLDKALEELGSAPILPKE